MKTLWLDRETWSERDLKEVGTYEYAATAEDLLVAYAVDEGPVMVWDCTADPIPSDLATALRACAEVWAHNAAFDKAIHLGPKQAHLPQVALPRWRCSMALALSHALPASLDDLCGVLGVPTELAKIKDGKKLVALFTRPQPASRKVQRATRHTHPDDWERFKQYAANDVAAMRECVRRMPKWNWDTTAIAEWHCDQRINERGFAVDRELTRAGAQAAITEKARIGQRFRELTCGIVDRPSQRAQFQEYVLSEFGVALPDTTKDTFTQLLKNKNLDSRLVELLELSMAANKTSTAKYARLEPAIQVDDRFRGGLQFAGAGRTRRWAGRMFQPQNLPSRGLPDAEDVEAYIAALKAGWQELFTNELMRYGAAALRGVVVAPVSKKLVVADLSNIEGRMLSWVAGEKWKLDAFREYDAGRGPDLYKVTASIITGVPPMEVPKAIRNSIGKVADLASGYMGGVSGYQKFAAAYNVRMADYWGVLQQQVSPEIIACAHKNLESWGRPQVESLEITELEWLASEVCKLAWRERHPATKSFWYSLQNGAKDAIRNPGAVFTVGPYLKVKVVNHQGQRWLVVKLPSGRYITYFQPHLMDDGSLAYYGEAAEEGKTTRQWVRVFTHGGKMTGNVCQTLARDILASALQTAEDRGYVPVLTVHDEIITETVDSEAFSADGLAEILATNPTWSAGLPLAAAAFESHRYKKD